MSPSPKQLLRSPANVFPTRVRVRLAAVDARRQATLGKRDHSQGRERVSRLATERAGPFARRSMSARSSERKPWPMKWVVLAIVLCIIPYTWLTLRYRKPGPAYQPYEDNKNRANILRLRDAGFQRISVEATRPSDPRPTVASGTTAALTERPGGLPALLSETLVEKPLLPESIISAVAAPIASATEPYAIQFACTVPDHREHLAGAELYVYEVEITVVPIFEKNGGELLSRTRDSTVLLMVPAGKLKPGHYTVTIVGARRSQSWMLDVK